MVRRKSYQVRTYHETTGLVSHMHDGGAPPSAANARVILLHDLPKVIYGKKLADGKYIKSYQ